jgi:hypothetical protein
LLGCYEDCDFSYLLEVPSLFNNYGEYYGDGTYNDTAFVNDVMLYLPSEVAASCIYTFESLAAQLDAYSSPSASSLMNNLSNFYKIFLNLYLIL